MSTQRPSIRPSAKPGPGDSGAHATHDPKVKGVAFRSVLACLEQLRGAAFVEASMGRLAADQAHMLRYTIVQTGWYPIALYRALWAAIVSETPGDYELVRAIGGATIRRDVGGVYRVLFKVLSIETLITLSSKLFPYYYDTGRLSNERVSANCIRSTYEGCIGFDRIMWEELAGSSSELIEMAGGYDVKVTISRGGQDLSTMCVIQIDWH